MNYPQVDPPIQSPMRKTASARSVPYDLGNYLAYVGKNEYIIAMKPFDPLEDFHYVKEGEFSSQAELEYILSEYAS